MNVFLLTVLKIGLRVLYAPLKLFKTKNRIVYLSRQSNEKSLDMQLLEAAITSENPSVEQVFRVRMIDEGLKAKMMYCLQVIGDMYYLATSKVAVLDTYSVTVSCLKHKKSLKVIQMWHALGATKKFGWQSVDTKEGRDKRVSSAMEMHRNYDYVIAPSSATAKFYMQAFDVDSSKIAICPLPRVDYIIDGKSKNTEFFNLNPGFTRKKIVLYLPTFRDREADATDKLANAFEGNENYQLIVSRHPLSEVPVDDKFIPNGNFSTFDLMKIADVIITDYSASAYEASLLMKPLYFYVPDYNEYIAERGLNVDLLSEMKDAAFEDAQELVSSVVNQAYDNSELFAFQEKYVENSRIGCSQTLAKFVLMQL